jgi:hypothetical protein
MIAGFGSLSRILVDFWNFGIIVSIEAIAVSKNSIDKKI